MKKFLVIIIAMLSVVTYACAKESNKMNKEAKKSLVAYFSATGTTEAVAKDLAKAASADLFQIEPTQKYTAADLDWHDEHSRSSVEMKDEKARPELKKNIENLDRYDVVYLGAPIWWGVVPRIVNTFIEANDLKGKTVVLFVTSGSSTVEQAAADLKAKYPEINWKTSRRFSHPTQSELEEFVKSVK